MVYVLILCVFLLMGIVWGGMLVPTRAKLSAAGYYTGCSTIGLPVIAVIFIGFIFLTNEPFFPTTILKTMIAGLFYGLGYEVGLACFLKMYDGVDFGMSSLPGALVFCILGIIILGVLLVVFG